MPISAARLHQAVITDLSAYIDTKALLPDIDASPTEVACYLLRDSIVRKWNPNDKPTLSQCAVAQGKFLSVNSRLAGWSLDLNTSADEELIGAVKRRLHQFWERFDSSEGVACCVPLVGSLNELFDMGRAGPGSSIQCRGEDLYTKMFDSPLSSTRQLADVWPRLLQNGSCFQTADAARRARYPDVVVDGCKLDFVPKNVDTARTIGKEPCVNMWLQLGFGEILSHRLNEVWGIHIPSQQSVQRRLAQRGSRIEDIVTLDLSSASDSIGVSMLKHMLPRDFLRWLMLLRCERIELPSGEWVDLNMISTMGNGFTFALQTVIFSAVVLGTYDFLGIKPIYRDGWASDGTRRERNLGVYGDDIICVTEAQRCVVRVLSLLGFQLNPDKSFVEGPFRESCGGDYYVGHNVRPVFVKRLNSYEDSFVAINRLNQWTALHHVPLRSTMRLILSSIKKVERFIVPMDENDDAGIRVPASYALLGSNVSRKEDGSLQYLRRVVRERSLYMIGGHCWLLDRRDKPRTYQPEGHMVCALGGYVNVMQERRYANGYSIVRYIGDTVTLRQRDNVYRAKLGATPSWDRMPTPGRRAYNGTATPIDVWSVETNLASWLVFGAGV